MRNANAQVQLIDDLLDVSRIVNGKLRLNIEAVDIRAVVEASIDTVRPSAEAKGIDLRSVFDPRALGITGDPARLQQVVWNLLANAVPFTSNGGHIEVELRRMHSHIEIGVRDTGQASPASCCLISSSGFGRETAPAPDVTRGSASDWLLFDI